MTSRCDFSHWDSVWRALGCHGDPLPWHKRLLAAYGEKGRHYHNLVHIHECLEELDRYRSLSAQPAILEVALWFHDAIYDPRSATNEADSADLATNCLNEAKVNEEVIDAARSLILCTKTHQPGGSPEGALIIDIDLAILGRPPTRFWEYEQAIAAEYAWVPAAVYAEKRTQVLQSFLSRSALYLTPAFAERFEAPARQNLQAAINRLRSSIR